MPLQSLNPVLRILIWALVVVLPGGVVVMSLILADRKLRLRRKAEQGGGGDGPAEPGAGGDADAPGLV